MNTIHISYDLGGPETSATYTALITAIKSYDNRCKPMMSERLIKTTKSTSEVCEHLAKYLDKNDKILCINVTGDWKNSKGLSQEVSKWLDDYM